jgi:hydrogenase-4 membrane subunit HyfE
MKDIFAIVLVIGVIVITCVAVIGLGLFVSRRMSRKAPKSNLIKPLSPTEVALYAAFAVVLFVGMGIRQLAPKNSLGMLLNSSAGLLFALGVIFVGFFLVITAVKFFVPRRSAVHRNKS